MHIDLDFRWQYSHNDPEQLLIEHVINWRQWTNEASSTVGSTSIIINSTSSIDGTHTAPRLRGWERREGREGHVNR